jgi:hypothetical protein
MDVADARRQEIDAQSDDLLAFFRIGDFAIGRDPIFGSADRADFGLDREALIVSEGDEFFRLGDILF